MKYTLFLTRAAELDITHAFLDYEEKRDGLGHDFLLCVEDALARIEKHPLHYQTVYKHLRRVLVRRFPYSVFYFEDDNKLIVTAVFHARSDPEAWDDRT